VIGTPVNFGGMTGRAFFENRAITKKVFVLAPAPAVQLYGPPYTFRGF
jgi:hypothetical protein